jgi:hypothetical protein
MKLILPGRRASASGHGARTRAATTTTQKQRAPAAPWTLVGGGGRASLFLMGGLGRASLFLMGGLGRLRRPRFLSARRGCSDASFLTPIGEEGQGR